MEEIAASSSRSRAAAALFSTAAAGFSMAFGGIKSGLLVENPNGEISETLLNSQTPMPGGGKAELIFSAAFHRQPRPARQKTHAANRRHRAEPARVCHRQQIKRAGENHDSRQKTPPRERRKRFSFREQKQHHRVDVMVENRLVPDYRRAVVSEQILQRVRPERAQHHGEKSRRRRDARGCGRIHFVSAAAAARCCNSRSRKVSSGAVAHAGNQRSPSSCPLFTRWPSRKPRPSAPASPLFDSLPSRSIL